MKILDTVWMVVTPKGNGVAYVIGNSARDVWEKVRAEQALGTMNTPEKLRKQGWRAKKVQIVLQEKEFL